MFNIYREMITSAPHSPSPSKMADMFFRIVLALRAKDFWQTLLAEDSSFFDNVPLETWIRINCSSKLIHISGLPWSTIFPLSCWCIRINRNRRYFDVVNNTTSPLLSMEDSIARAVEWEFHCHRYPSKRNTKTLEFGWNPPTAGCLKLHVDGACSKHGITTTRWVVM